VHVVRHYISICGIESTNVANYMMLSSFFNKDYNNVSVLGILFQLIEIVYH